MSDGRHAELLEVIPRELGEDLAVNLIVTERRLVFAQPKASQPVSNVHSHVPNTCDAHSFRDFDGSGCSRWQKALNALLSKKAETFTNLPFSRPRNQA